MRALVLAAALMAAGCAGPTSPADDPLPTPQRHSIGLTGTVPLSWGTECLPTGTLPCFASTWPYDMPRLMLAGNETPVAIHAQLLANGSLPPGATVVFRVDCDSGVGPECPVLAEVQGELPLQVALPAVSVPAGAALRFSGHLVGGDTHVDVVSATAESFRDYATEQGPAASLQGHVEVLRDPAPAVDWQPVQEVRTIEGDLFCTQADYFVQPGGYDHCPAWSRTWYSVGDFRDRPLTALHAELVWTANRETVRDLVLLIDCRQGHELSKQPCAGLPAAEVRGASPLTLDLDGWAPPDAVLRIEVFSPVAPIGDQAPQPYRLSIEATVLQDPAEVGERP